MINFPDYENFNDVDIVYSDFIQYINSIYKQNCTLQGDKNQKLFPRWFDGEILDTIILRDKRLKKCKVSGLNIDKQLYKEAKINVQKLIKNKKRFLPKKLRENVGKSEEIWKTLKSLS